MFPGRFADPFLNLMAPESAETASKGGTERLSLSHVSEASDLSSHERSALPFLSHASETGDWPYREETGDSPSFTREKQISMLLCMAYHFLGIFFNE